jgi:hypothetical protein
MSDPTITTRRTAHVIRIAVGGTLLLIAAVGLMFWLLSGPTVYASGHRWAVYPSNDQYPEADSSTEPEKLAFDGNVRLFSLLHAEHFTEEKGEQLREVLCHVLVDLPPQAVLEDIGGGVSKNGSIERRAKVVFRKGDKVRGPEAVLKLRMRPADRRLVILVDDVEHVAREVSSAGDVLLLRFDEQGKTDGVVKVGEQIVGLLDADDVERLMGRVNARDGQTKS